MSDTWRKTGTMVLLAAVFSVALAVSSSLLTWDFVYNDGVNAANRPAELALVVSLALLLLFPLIVLTVQWRLYGRGQQCPSRLQLAISVLAVPSCLLILSSVPAAEPHLSVSFPVAVLVSSPTVLAILVQGLWFRWRAGAELQGAAAGWTSLVLGVSALATGFYVVVWGSGGASEMQLLPVVEQALTWVAFLAAAAALVIMVQWGVGPRSLPKSRHLSVKRTVSVATATILFAVVGWALLPTLLAEAASTKTVEGRTYIITTAEDGRQCFHKFDSAPYMTRLCTAGLDPNPLLSAKKPAPPPVEEEQSAGQKNPPGSAATDQWPGQVLPEQVVARAGKTAIIMVDSSLGQKGRFVSAQKTADGWQAGPVMAEGVSFVELSEVDGVLFASFTSDPRVFVMNSTDGGLTWIRADLQDEDLPIDMREFRGVEAKQGQFVLTIGYPLWVDADEAFEWTSQDGVTWSGPVKTG